MTTGLHEGWKYIHVSGAPKVRGRAYGRACADDFTKIRAMLDFFMLESYGQPWEWFIKEIWRDFGDFTKTKYGEFYAEMEGIAEGCRAGGCDTSLEEILAWNFYLSIPAWYSTHSDVSVGKEGGGGDASPHVSTATPTVPPRYDLIKQRAGAARDHCSAFMAVGPSWTDHGQIVVAHNSFSDFIDGQYAYVILDLEPDHGFRFVMQTSPCWIWSGTDFFVTAAGIIGTETTIGGFFPYELRTPIGYRIRHAMQYGRTLDDYVSTLLTGNSGDYANSWLFGDIRRGEILRLELGLKYHAVERTRDGVFIGFNAAYDPRIRNLECVNSGFYDIRRHQGARYVRLSDLMDKYRGRLNVETAKAIIADHYDVYTGQENPCSRTVCAHYELDAREFMSQADRPKPFAPHGALDGCVCDSALAARLQFWGRYGNSCGRAFDPAEFISAHRQWEVFAPYLMARPSRPWVVLGASAHASPRARPRHHRTIKRGGRRTRRHRKRTVHKRHRRKRTH